MKNADRINFYLAGLRQAKEGQAHSVNDAAGSIRPTAPDSLPPSAASPADQGGTPDQAAMLDQAAGPDLPAMPDLPMSLTLHSKLPVGQLDPQVAAPDQAQLHRLLQRLEGGRQRLGDWQDRSPEAVRKRHRQLIIGLVLAGIIIAAQASAVIWLYQRAELLLGRPLSPALLWTASAGDLTVTFRPSASAGDVAVLLRELDLQVVDGPDTGSRYVVRPHLDDDSKRDLNALRDRRDLVYSADPTY
jgi:hypothetical protein